MKTQFTTIISCTLKVISIGLLLIILNACQEEILIVEEESTTQYSSTNTEIILSQNTQEDTLLFSLDFENGLTTHDLENPSLVGNINFTTGINGLGLCVGAQDTLQYLAEGNIDHSKGSVSVWIKPNWNPGQYLYKILYFGRNPKHFEMHVDENKLVAFGLNSASMDSQPIRVAFGDASHWNAGEWHHIVYTWSSEYISLHIDGQLMELVNVGYEIPEVSDEVFHIGSVSGIEGFNGVIDELRIFNYQLEHHETEVLFNEYSANVSKSYVEDCDNQDDGATETSKYNFLIEVVTGSLIDQTYDGYINLNISNLDHSCLDTLLVESMHFYYQNRCFTERDMDYQPYVVFNRGELQDLFLVGGPTELRFGINDGFQRYQFGREEEQWIRDGGSYFGYLDEYTFVDGAGKITYSKE